PAFHVLFVTKEQHRTSGVADVVPPVTRWNCEVNDARIAGDMALTQVERHEGTAIAAWSSDRRIRPKGGRDAQSIPDANPPVPFSQSTDPKARRDRTEWIGGPDISVVWGKY